MKSRVSFLLFVSMLVAGVFSQVAAGPATAEPPCGESGSALERAVFATESTQAEYCGVCSSRNCQGLQQGSMCYSPYSPDLWGWCYAWNGTNTCSQDGQWQCTCGGDMS
jgi:hypothetical protein